MIFTMSLGGSHLLLYSTLAIETVFSTKSIKPFDCTRWTPQLPSLYVIDDHTECMREQFCMVSKSGNNCTRFSKHAHKNNEDYTYHHQLQWNPSITDTFGEQCFNWPLYRGGLCWEVVLYKNCSFGTWVPGRYIATGLYSGVVVNRGSTVPFWGEPELLE